MAIIKKDSGEPHPFQNSWPNQGAPKQEKSEPAKPLTAEEKVKLAKSVTTQLNNEYKDGGILVQKMGKRSTGRWPSLPTDLPTFDELVLGCGGMPDGRIIEIYGPESAGKTAFSLHVIGCAQRAGGLPLFVDAEHALTLIMLGPSGSMLITSSSVSPIMESKLLKSCLHLYGQGPSGLLSLILSLLSYQRLS